MIEITNFMKNQLKDSKMDNFILGLSGGIDSTVVLALAVEAVGRDHVKCYTMPYFDGLKSTIKAIEIAEDYGVEIETISIKSIVDAYNVSDDYRRGYTLSDLNKLGDYGYKSWDYEEIRKQISQIEMEI